MFECDYVIVAYLSEQFIVEFGRDYALNLNSDSSFVGEVTIPKDLQYSEIHITAYL